MHDRAPRGDAEQLALARFRRLVDVALVATFALIVIGGIVRVSDSGLGCGPAGSGTHGWPLCEGGVVPSASAESVIEYTHRIVAGIVALLIIAIAWQAWRQLHDHRSLVRGSLAGVALVLAQAALGGLTVEEGLHEALVAAHLGLAMLLLGLLLLLRRGAEPDPGAARPRGSATLRVTAALASALVFATIVAGGYVAGTEKEGTPGEPAVGQAHVACGTGFSTATFPGCNGRFPGFGQGELADIQLVHRTLMYLAAVAVLLLAALAARERVRPRAFALAGVLLILQIALGAANVWFDKHAGLIVGHLTLATLLWGTVVYAASYLLPLTSAAGTRVGGREPAEAAA